MCKSFGACLVPVFLPASSQGEAGTLNLIVGRKSFFRNVQTASSVSEWGPHLSDLVENLDRGAGLAVDLEGSGEIVVMALRLL